MKQIITYLQPLIEGNDGNISIKNVIAIAMSIAFIINMNRSTEGILGITAGLIAALLGLQVYNNLGHHRIEADENVEIQKANPGAIVSDNPDKE